MAHPTIVAFRRRLLEDWIERAIALLDELDGDADFEAGADLERDETETISDLPSRVRLQRWPEGGFRGGSKKSVST